MFDFLKKNAEIELQLNSNELKLWSKLTWKVVIKPLADFTSNSLDILLNWTERWIFVNDNPFKRNIQLGTQFYTWDIKELPFEIDFVSTQELNSWYDSNVMGVVPTNM
jgi:hypothetical protein